MRNTVRFGVFVIAAFVAIASVAQQQYWINSEFQAKRMPPDQYNTLLRAHSIQCQTKAKQEARAAIMERGPCTAGPIACVPEEEQAKRDYVEMAQTLMLGCMAEKGWTLETR